MTENEKLEMLKAIMPDTDDSEEVLSAYLQMAGYKIIAKAYPYDDTVMDVPEKYHPLQVEIAQYLLNKRGAEGETGHTENGITRTYGSADVPLEMLRSVIPHTGVPR